MPAYNLPSEFSAETERISRKRKLAEALMQQGMTPAPTGQMAGGAFVPTSPLTHLANALKGYIGVQKGNQADQELLNLGRQAEERRGADASLLVNALSGRKASPAGLSEDASGNVTPTDYTAAQTPVEALQQSIPMMGSEMQPAGVQALQAALGREDTQKFQAEQKDADRALRREMQDVNLAFRPPPGSQPYFTPLQTGQGVYSFDSRTGTAAPVTAGGKPIVGAQNDPALQGTLAQSKASGKEKGEAAAQAQIDLPRVVNNATNSLGLIDQLVGSEDGKVKAHPGFSSSVGMGVGPIARRVPGSNSADFQALLDQVKGGAFLEAFNSLKGGGQITEVEGKKATDAITRMQTAQSEKEFIKAAREYQQIIRLGVQRAQQKAGGQSPDQGGWSIRPLP